MIRNTTINTRQKKIREAFIEQLKRTPTIETSCQKVGVGRATIYRWMKKSKVFEASVQEALLEGRLLMNDVAENQLFALIGEKKYEAIKFYLSTHNSRYSNKIELSGSVSTNDTPLTKEQKKLIREALKLSTVRNYDKEK